MGGLKQSARANDPAALKTATQFEAMFVNMMMKSMREATPQDG
jgi:flagellar protein FlgJ